MAQIKFPVDINAAEFPLLYDWSGRTVLNEQENIPEAPLRQPQILYCEDVLPTQQGYKSVSYKNLIGAASPSNLNFSNVFTVSDQAQNKALIGVTFDSHIYILTNALPTWVDVTPVGWAGGDKVTYGNANGVWYLYLYKFGCYAVNITTASLTATALTAITAANILGMSSAVDYLILWDANGTVYWSSTTNPLDFTPSIITGAGSQIPYDLAGLIVIIVPLNNGFVIYTSQNIVLASFSNNTQYPWIFRNANGGSGIADYRQVSVNHDLAFHVVNTFAGMLQVTPQGCTVIVPELSDFIAARLYESYDRVNNVLNDQVLTANVMTRVTCIAARWIVLSYGISSYTDALVYDMGLKRWGKCHVNHVCCYEIETNMEGVIQPYNAASEVGATYAAASPQTYNSTAVNIAQAPLAGRVFGFLQVDGTLMVAFADYNAISGNAVLLLGKLQATRNYFLELQEIEIETIPANNTGLTVLDIPSINGRDWLAPVTPTLLENGADIHRYVLRSVARNHVLAFLGSFNLTAVGITATLGSRR